MDSPAASVGRNERPAAPAGRWQARMSDHISPAAKEPVAEKVIPSER
jgi:hypothetical protein